MLSTVRVIDYGGNNGIIFYFSVDTNSFDYELMTRECTVKVYAVSARQGAVIESTDKDSSISIFGKTFVLPQTVTINGTENTVLGEYVISGISGEAYPSDAVCNVNLAYKSDSFNMYAYNKNFTVPIGKIHLAPIVTPVGGNRTALGSKLIFSGDVFEEGYVIDATIKHNGTTYYKYSLEESGRGFYSEDYWLIYAGAVNEFTATVTFKAKYKGVLLPQTYALPITFYLPEGKGLPSATVTSGFTSDNEVVASLGIGIKNKTSFKIEVSDMRIFYGAFLSKCSIVVDGTEYLSTIAETPVLTESGEHNWSVTITDTRGRKFTYTGTFQVSDYALPDFTVSVKRTDATGNESKIGECIYLDFSVGEEYDLGGNNLYRYSFAYRAIGKDVDFIGDILLQNGVTIHNGGLNSTLMYEVCVKGADSLGSETVKSFILDCERIELNIAKNKVAVGKKAKKERTFECAWDIESDGDVSFTDDRGEMVSLREYCRALPLSYDNARAGTEAEISAALAEFQDTAGRIGGRLLLLYVAAEGLTLGKGLHVYFGHSDGEQFVFSKL